MALASGTRLGPYEVVAPLGAGGMGEVYRARDTRLERSVAIKVLAPDLAGDGEFRQRFHTEARAISQLTHPHICTLHDIGEHEGTTFLVMELLAGETLADRLARGTPEQPALTLEQALQIGIQIADALAAAHAQGIVHRDLKPGNIMLTKAATPSAVPHAKLLDFGLAKATPAVMSAGLSIAPTTPPQAVTAQGAILGTIQYMAPEQVEGGAVDTRSDIFAFGSVLYELLTGRKAFEGKTQANVMAAILEREPPPVSALAPRVPALVEATVQKCLAKNPDERWQSAADLATALRWATSGPFATASSGTAAPNVAAHRTRPARLAAVGALVVAAGAAGGLLTRGYLSANVPNVETVRFDVQPPPNVMWSPSPIASTAQLAISPDGNRLAFVAAATRGVSQIWVRPLETTQAQPLAGSDGASFPFWSPDGRAIGFFANGRLKKIDLAGGAPQPLADAPNGRGAAWSQSGDIVFTPAPNSPTLRLSPGGTLTQDTRIDAGVVTQYWPQFLPDGRRYLYYQRSSTPEVNQGVYVKTIGVDDAKLVMRHNGMAIYTRGYLFLVRDSILFAIAFDERTLQTRGEPLRVADQVGFFGGTFGYAAITASATGTVVHGPSVLLTTNLQWRDRSGLIVGSPAAPGVYKSPRLSPDQNSVALTLNDPQSQSPDIWILELTRTRGGLSRVTSDPRNDWSPVWAPDGGRLFFSSTRAGSSTLFQKVPSQAGNGEQLTETAFSGMYPTDVSSDASLIITHQTTNSFSQPTAGGGYDIVVVPLTADRTPRPFLATQFNEVQARLAPNGRWVAYASDESGRFEVYVRPFPTGTGQWPISRGGGMQPEWRRDGKELFYVSADGKMMTADVAIDGETLTAAVPRALFDVDITEATAPYATDYAVSGDGRRFLVNTIVDQPIRPSLTVILNWTAGLKEQ